MRHGNVHRPEGWDGVLTPVVARYPAEARPSIMRRRFRADAACAISVLCEDKTEMAGLDRISST
ncbi:hypothetical protein [Hoeflea sp. IMCC20628]|uniref:hypothetical protein n=1 Tax=Hoeflea sp. IMCC20628 TaxID=1620421 RepID=UPI0012E056CD|nr:hypothetical protein [Hoeflea sp. IMCC20628]